MYHKFQYKIYDPNVKFFERHSKKLLNRKYKEPRDANEIELND